MKINIYSIFSTSLFKNASYLVINSVIGSITGFIFWLIAAKMYTDENVGLASAIISLIGLLSLISNLGFSISLIHFIPRLKENATSLINSCFTISSLVALLLCLFFITNINFFSPVLSFLKSDCTLIIIFISFTLLTIISNLQDSVFIGYRKANLSFIKMLIQSLLKIPGVIILGSLNSMGIIASYGIAYLVAVIVGMGVLIPKVNFGYYPIPMLNIKVYKKIRNYSFGNYISWIFESLPTFILPLMIGNLLNPEMTAYFYITWMIAGVIFVIPKSFSMSLFAEGSSFKHEIHNTTIFTLKITLLLLVPSIIFIIFFGDNILSLFGKNYAIHGKTLLILLALSTIPMTINNTYISICRLKNKIFTANFINFILSFGSCILSYFAISLFGILGVGLSWLFCQVISNLIILLLLLKRKIILYGNESILRIN